MNDDYNQWTHQRIFEQVNLALGRRWREKRPLGPTGASIDRQSVTGTQASGFKSGCDGGKLVPGRKRHIVVDTMGCLLVVWVHAANMFDGKAACQVITNLFLLLQTVKIIWAAGGNSGGKS